MPEQPLRNEQRGRRVSVVNLDRGGLSLIYKVAWPVALSALFAQLMNIVDAFWVGRLGPAALAAVGTAGSVFGVLIALGQMVNAPVMAFVARFAGKDDRAQVQAVLFHGLILALILGVVTVALGVPSSRSLLGLLAADAEVAATGTPYLVILFIIMPVAYISAVLYTSIQATGDTLSPLLVSFVANLINLALDPLLIFGWLGMPRLGVAGAGVATGIATLAGAVMAFVIVWRRDLLRMTLPRISLFGKFLKIGFFAMIQGITRPLTGTLMFFIAGLSGKAVQAAFTVGLRIIGIPFIFITGLTVATQSLVGQYLGVGNPDGAVRVVRRSSWSGLALQIVLSALIFLGAFWLVGVFSPGQKEIIGFGSGYLRVMAPFLLLLPFSMTFAGAQYGAGRTLGPAAASVAANWITKLPLAYVLSQHTQLGPTGIWLAIGISVVVETLVNAIYYLQGKWKEVKL